LGLSASFGLRDDKLDDLSAGYVLETQRLELAVLGILRGYNRAEYTREQQVSFDVCEWYLDNQVRGREFTLHANPLNHFVNGYIFQLNDLLTDLHPLEHRQNAEDYIARLSQVNDQVSQLLAGMGHREAMGHVPPDFILRMTRQEISRSLGTSTPTAGTIRAPLLTVYTTLSDALQEMDDLTDEEKNALCEATLHQIRDAFIPAYLDLLSAIDRLLPLASSDASVWSLPEGETFYAFALRQETSIELTPEQVHQMGLAEVERIQAEMRLLFDELGYPQDRPVGELIRRAIAEGGTVDSSQIISANQALIAEIDERVQTIFDLRTRAPAVVIAEPAFGGYDTPASADSSRPAALHASGGTSGANRAEMPTIAYHEAIPGHHFQIALTQEMELPIFRKHAFFNAHGEGWALYAERLACELGVCEDDPYGDLGGLRLKLFRAVRLVVDTGIHAKRWTREVERYVAWPAQATGYQIGMMKILELRQRAMDQLGDHCDLKEFHNVVLGNGVLPLTILEALVNEYIADRQ
jgi:uncharacterized protein (DUF885 family)